MKYAKSWLVLFVSFTLSFVSSCEGNSDPYEELDKLRTIGVAADKPIVAPSTTTSPQIVTLTVYAVVPLGETIAAETFAEENSIYAVNVSNLQLVNGSATYTDYPRLRLYTVRAQFPVPSNDILKLGAADSVRLRYGFKLTSPGEEEKIVGDVLVRPEGSEELSYKGPTIDILKPLTGNTIGKGAEVDIEAHINNPTGEGLKVGWFVSNGAIKNRRASSTKWKTGGEDEQFIIATVRGKRTRAFDIKIMRLRAE